MSEQSDSGQSRFGPRDFKLEAVFTRTPEYEGDALDADRPVKTEALVRVQDAFRKNLLRRVSLNMLPAWLFSFASTGQRAYDEATIEYFPGKTLNATPDSLAQAVLKHRAKELFHERLFAMLAEPDSLKMQLSRGMHNVQLCMETAPAMSVPAIEAWLASLLLSGWTAFEALATDCWVAAVNTRPRTLGRMAFLAPRPDGGIDVESDAVGAAKVTAPSLDELMQYDFRTECGTMLLRRRKFDFTSLRGIRLAYRAAFRERDGKQQGAVLPIVGEWFPKNDDLATLEAMRHVLVHRGGAIDKPFLDRVKNHSLFSDAEEHKELELDGEIVARYTRLATARGLALLYGLDEWLATTE